MATQVALPSPNVDYSLTLGASFAPEPGDEVETSYAALRYDFRPASADMEQPGVLLLGKDNRVSLYLANSATCELDVLLSGKYEPCAGGGHPTSASQGRDCLDCIALFDPITGTFRLETLLGQYNTKHVRDAPPYRPPADDHTDLSPGTSGSAGPGPSMSPPGAQQAQRRSDSPLPFEDMQTSGHLQQQQSNAAMAYANGAGAGTAAAARNSKPPRPPGAGRSVATAGAGGAQGKKRQRDAGAAASSGAAAGSSPGVKKSRLSKTSVAGAQEQGRGQGKRGGAKAAARQARQPAAAAEAPGLERSNSRGLDGALAQTAPAPAAAIAGPGCEDDVDAALLDAFDTFDADPFDADGSEAAAAPDETGAGSGADAGGTLAATPLVMTATPPAASAPVAIAAAAHNTGDCGAVCLADASAVPLPASAMHAVGGGALAVAPTPTLEVVHDEEEEDEEAEEEEQPPQHHHLNQDQLQEPEAVPPPAARLVVEDMDDDDGYAYAGEEEFGMGLGIEYF